MIYLSHNNFVGNIVPHEWYSTITTTSGRPDLTSISIFSEIVYWYRPKSVTDKVTKQTKHVAKFWGEVWQTSYAHFQKKFNFSHETIRRSLVKLEKLGLIRREFKTISLRGQQYNNALFIRLNSSHPSKQPEKESSTEPIIFSPFQEDPSPQILGDIIEINKNNYKENRSIACAKSNFYRNFSSNPPKVSNQQLGSLIGAPPSDSSAKAVLKLRDFYPLSQQDCNKLQTLSGREFSARAMNEILLDMSERLKDRWFKGKKSFLNYMSKAFKYEMRDAVKIGNDTFSIKNNFRIKDPLLQEHIAENLEIKKQEQYLSEVEYNLEVSPEWHFKKKLASVLERSTAYNLLTSYVNSNQEGGAFVMRLNKHVTISQMERKIILEQVKATQERGDFASGEFNLIERLEIITPEPAIKEERKHSLEFQNQEGEGANPAQRRGEDSNLKGVWGRVRRSIAEYYGQKGQGIDKAWFSKLEPEVDEAQKMVKLKAPTNFIRDWIGREYSQVITLFMQNEDYQYQIC